MVRPEGKHVQEPEKPHFPWSSMLIGIYIFEFVISGCMPTQTILFIDGIEKHLRASGQSIFH